MYDMTEHIKHIKGDNQGPERKGLLLKSHE